MRALVVLHVPDSPFGAVRIGYGRVSEAMTAAGDSLGIVTPERFRLVSRLHPRWRVLALPFAVALWLWRRRRSYDVVVFHSYVGWVFQALRGSLPAITSFHGVEPLEYVELDAAHRARGARLSWRYRLVHGWMMRQVLRWTCRRSTRVTCLNSEEAAWLVDHGWVTRERLVVLHHGIPDFFYVDDRTYAPRATRIVFVSQWVERKGLPHLAEAFAALARERADLELWCLGTRQPADVVRATFPADVRRRVQCVPELTQVELAKADADADIFVHTSLNEAYGLAIAEAMASALPIVTTPVGVSLDHLEHERDCLVVPKADAAACAAALRRLLDDRALRERLGRGARRAAEPLRAAIRDAAVVALLQSLVRTRAS